MNDLAKNLLLWVVILVVLMTVFQSFNTKSRAQPELLYSEFMGQVKSGNVGEVVIEDQTIRGTLKDGTRFIAISPETDNRSMVGELLANNVKFSGALPKETPLLMQLLFNAFPILLLIAVRVGVVR